MKLVNYSINSLEKKLEEVGFPTHGLERRIYALEFNEEDNIKVTKHNHSFLFIRGGKVELKEGFNCNNGVVGCKKPIVLIGNNHVIALSGGIEAYDLNKKIKVKIPTVYEKI